jgi:hypothetical protein
MAIEEASVLEPGKLARPKESNVESKIAPVEKVKIKSLTAGARIEEAFLRFCTNVIEAPERGGKFPEKYSNLTSEELLSLISHNGERVATHGNWDKALEKRRIIDAIRIVEKHKDQSAIVHTEEDLENPLGNLGNVRIFLFSDFHYAPSNVKTGINVEAFRRYFPQRVAEHVSDEIAQRKDFGNVKGEISENDENLILRWVMLETARHQFMKWTTDVVAKQQLQPEKDQSTPIIFALGDNVHAGAFLLDQLAINTELRGLVDELDLRRKTQSNKQVGSGKTARLLELAGNHDEDSRNPDAFEMLSELYGHKVFTQEVDENVMIAALDTNIENPVWVKQFTERASERGKTLLEKRRELQEQVIEKIKQHKGPIVLVGHNPSRLIDAFAVKRDLIQNSNIRVIVGGHTHTENHFELPFKNKKGETITMHVLESVVRIRDGRPLPPKLYSLDIRDGKIGDVRTMQQPKESFDRDYMARLEA